MEDVGVFSFKSDPINNIVGTEPIDLVFKGKNYPLEHQWANLPAKICLILKPFYPDKVRKLMGKVRNLMAKGTIPNMAKSSSRFSNSQYVPEEQVNCPEKEIVRFMRLLCRRVGIALAEVEVTYCRLEDGGNNPHQLETSLHGLQCDVVKQEDCTSQQEVQLNKMTQLVDCEDAKYHPLVDYPNLAIFLWAKDKSRLNAIIRYLLNLPHGLGFQVWIESTRSSTREISGSLCLIATRQIVVLRCWTEGRNNQKKYSRLIVDIGEGLRTLASALYLAERLTASRKRIKLTSSWTAANVEARLRRRIEAYPELAAKTKMIGGRGFMFDYESADVTGTKPVSLFVEGTENILKNWRDLMIRVCDVIASEKQKLFVENVEALRVSWISNSPDGMRRPFKHELSGVYVELNIPSQSIIEHAKILFEKCGYDLTRIGVVYSNRQVMENSVRGMDRINTMEQKKVECICGEQWSDLPSSVGKAMERMSSGEIESLADFEEDVTVNYPSGFDFKETSRRLVEARVGKPMSDAMVEVFKTSMFERADGMWLMSRMVISKDRRDQMIERAKGLLEQEGFFAMDSLYGEFEGDIKNIPCGRDFKRFFNKFMAEKVGGKVRGHEGWRVCLKADITEEDGWGRIADRVCDVLGSSGDAVSIEDILSQMPHLDCEVILRVCQENIKDSVIFSMDEIQYAKLLEAYYLPDDFGETLSAFVNETESSQGVASIVLLEAEFEAKYGEGFRVNFGLEDDAVFKQVVAKSFVANDHSWSGDAFVGAGATSVRNVADEFVNVRKGVFHEEEFFKYALERRGLANHASLVCQYLRTRCIRLNKTMWIGLADFVNRKIVNDDVLDSIRRFLNEQLGSSEILHIGLIPDMAIEGLTPMVIDGNEYHWNRYSITSVIRHLIKDLNLVNDEPSPYCVTSILLPANVELKNGDVVDHVFAVCRASGAVPQSADEAFDYLKERLVRTTRTAKLMDKIRNIWGF